MIIYIPSGAAVTKMEGGCWLVCLFFVFKSGNDGMHDG
jgi:hypothetical protein